MCLPYNFMFYLKQQQQQQQTQQNLLSSISVIHILIANGSIYGRMGPYHWLHIRRKLIFLPLASNSSTSGVGEELVKGKG